MISAFGWIGSFFFCICAVPQAWKCFKQGHAKGISVLFMILWLLGELFTLVYALTKLQGGLPIVVNLIVNIFFIVVIFKYICFPRVRLERGE